MGAIVPGKSRSVPTMLTGMVLVCVAVLVSPIALGAGARPANHVATTCSVGGSFSSPSSATYDPVNHRIYVTDYGAGVVKVLKAPCTVVATITLPTGAGPFDGAFSPQNNWIYVTDANLNQVYGILGNKVVATLPSALGVMFTVPTAIAYDPAAQEMAVTNFGSNNVSMFSGTTMAGPVGVGSAPAGIAYDPSLNSMIVTNSKSDNITLFNATFPTGLGFGQLAQSSYAVGSTPYGIAFNPAEGRVYIANSGSGNVSVFAGIVGVAIVASIDVGSTPIGVVFSQAKIAMYVTNYGSGNVSIIRGGVAHSVALASGAYPYFPDYDAANDLVYVPGEGTNSVYVLH